MATVQRLQTISIIYSVSDHRIYAIKFLDKDYINNFVQSASGLVDNSAITQSSTAIYWAIQYLNNTYNLNMSLASQSDSYLASQGQDGLIPVYANDGSITYTFNNCRFVCVAVLSDFHESGSGGGGSSADYTDVLEDINNNLTALNTNIANKNNQSDIVDCLNNIFCYTYSNNSKKSVLKDEYLATTDGKKNNLNICHLLYVIYAMLNSSDNVSSDDLQSGTVNYRVLYNISRKLALTFNNAEQDTILGALTLLRNAFVSDTSITASNARLNSYLKQISDKLANSNDLHTISQAIDLISTAIAQGDQSQELGAIKDSIDNLHLEQNNLIQVEGVLDYRLKPTDAE